MGIVSGKESPVEDWEVRHLDFHDAPQVEWDPSDAQPVEI